MERANKAKGFVIGTSESKYIKDLLKAIIEDNSSKGWKETLSRENYDMKWVGASIDDEELMKVLNQERQVIVNRYPGIQGLCHKDTFNKIIKVGEVLNSQFFTDFVPAQFSFPQDSDRFRVYHESNPGSIFIAKPVASSEGNGVVLFKQLSEIPSQLGAEMVVQRYIHNPLLIDGFKFDLRIYIVITQINPLQAFICDEGLARFCTEKYEAPSKENFKKFFMHLTNYSINKHSEDYKESPYILEANEDSKRTLASLWKTFARLGIDKEAVMESIKQTCAKTLSVYGPMIEHGVAIATNSKPVKGKYFQILGFDLLIDENLKAYILEINDHPSLNIYLEKDYMGGGMGKSLSEIDFYVKKRVVADAIKLAKKPVDSITGIDSFRSLTKIFPVLDPQSGDARIMEITSIVNKMRELYYEIGAVKQKLNITSSNFEKLRFKAKEYGGQPETFELNLIFQKIAQSTKFVEFHQFIYLLQGLKELLERKYDISQYEVRTLSEFIMSL